MQRRAAAEAYRNDRKEPRKATTQPPDTATSSPGSLRARSARCRRPVVRRSA